MNYMFLDSSSRKTFGQVRVGDSLNFFEWNTDRDLGSRISGLCDEMLVSVHASLGDIDLLGICVGPGSLTGLRVSAAFMRALAFISGKPLVGIDLFSWTVRSLSHLPEYSHTSGAFVKQEVSLLIPALLHQFFAVDVVVNSASNNPLSTPRLVKLENLARDSVKIGIRCEGEGMKRIDPSSRALDEIMLIQRAAGGFDDILRVLPLYIIPSQAEMKLENKT